MILNVRLTCFSWQFSVLKGCFIVQAKCFITFSGIATAEPCSNNKVYYSFICSLPSTEGSVYYFGFSDAV